MTSNYQYQPYQPYQPRYRSDFYRWREKIAEERQQRLIQQLQRMGQVQSTQPMTIAPAQPTQTMTIAPQPTQPTPVTTVASSLLQRLREMAAQRQQATVTPTPVPVPTPSATAMPTPTVASPNQDGGGILGAIRSGLSNVGGAIGGGAGAVGSILNRAFPKREYSRNLGPNQPLNLFNPRAYGPMPVSPAGPAAGAQAIIPYAERATQTALGTYQVPFQPLGTSLGTEEQTEAGMNPLTRAVYRAVTTPVNVLMPEIAGQMVAGEVAGGEIGQRVAGERGRHIGEMGGALAGPLVAQAATGLGKAVMRGLPGYMEKQALSGYPEQVLGVPKETVAAMAEEAPKVSEAAQGEAAKPSQIIAAKVAADLGGTSSAPEELLRQATNAPKGELPGRTLIRLYEGGVRADLMKADQEVKSLVDLLKPTGIPNKAKLARNEISEAVIGAVDYQGPIEEGIAKYGLNPEEATFVRAAREVMDGETVKMIAANPDFQVREFYWPHEWQPKRVVAGGGGMGGKIGTKPFFMKARQLEGSMTDIIAQREADIAAAEAAGKAALRTLEPVTWNPVEMVQRRLRRGIIYRRQIAIANQLKQVGLARPASEFEGIVADWRTPRGFSPFESKPVPGNPEAYTQPWYVPNEIASAIEDNFKGETGWQRSLLRGSQEVVATLKFGKVFGGLFQDFDYSMRTVAEATKSTAGGIAHGNVQRTVDGLKMLGTPFRALARGYVPGLDAKWTAIEVAGKDASSIRRMTLLEQGLNAEAGLGFMGSEYTKAANEMKIFKLPIVGRALKAFGSGSFSGAHREFLLDIGEKRMAALEAGGMNATEAAARTALDMNETFSSLPAWQSVFRDPNTRLVMRNLFFSTPEQESWLRMPFRQKAFFLSIMADVVAMENMASLAFNHELLPLEAYIPFNKDGSFNTRFLRAHVGTGADDRQDFLDLLGQADTTMRIASMVTPIIGGAVQGKVQGPSPSPLSSRFNIVPSTGLQLVGGKSWFGGEPTRDTPGHFVNFMANQALPIPATSVSSEQARIGPIAAAMQLSGINISAERLADLRNRIAAADPQFGKPYEELDRQAKMDYRTKYPQHFATSEDMPTGSTMQRSLQLSEEKTQRMKAIGDLYNANHNGDAYRSLRSEIQTDIAIRQDEINAGSDWQPKTEQEAAVAEWNKMIADAKAAAPAQTLTGDDFSALEDTAQQQMGVDKWKLVTDWRMSSADPVEKQYLRDRSTLEPYWSLQDQLWERFIAGTPSLQGISYQDFKQQLAQMAMSQGVAPQDFPAYDAIIGRFEDLNSEVKALYRQRHPDVDALLLKWGYASSAQSPAAAILAKRQLGYVPHLAGVR